MNPELIAFFTGVLTGGAVVVVSAIIGYWMAGWRR